MIYLEDSYVKEFDATILEVTPESEGRWRVVLDQSAFYPMGGGQATDQGTLSSENWSGKVYQVLNQQGVVVHFVQAESAPEKGMAVHGEIDWDRRYLNMRLHSAGHIVDFALYRLGLSPNLLKPTKADHRKKPHIVYEGTASDPFQEELHKQVDELVSMNLKFTTRMIDASKIADETLYLQPNLPTNKPLRVLCLEGVGCVADGGTQVRSTSECGQITVTKIDEKDGYTTVYYKI